LSGTTNQQFTSEYLNDTHFKILSKHKTTLYWTTNNTGHTVKLGSSANATVFEQTPVGDANQHCSIYKAVKENKCLETEKGGDASRTNLALATCSSSKGRQHWCVDKTGLTRRLTKN